jgi:hypothetical protein
MNKPLLRKIASYIETHPRQYNQGEWCGTACCVAGHALVLSGFVTREVIGSGGRAKIRIDDEDCNVPILARAVLDLTPGVASELFGGYWMCYLEDLPTQKAKAAAAAKVIRSLVRTGKVPSRIPSRIAV